MIFVTEEAAKSKKTLESEIPKQYVLETIFQENGKSYELWHDPNQTDLQLCYIKREVGNKW